MSEQETVGSKAEYLRQLLLDQTNAGRAMGFVDDGDSVWRVMITRMPTGAPIGEAKHGTPENPTVELVAFPEGYVKAGAKVMKQLAEGKTSEEIMAASRAAQPTEPPFKVGDEVECVKFVTGCDREQLRLGAKYKIREICDSSGESEPCIRVGTMRTGWKQSRFRPAPSIAATPTAQVDPDVAMSVKHFRQAHFSPPPDVVVSYLQFEDGETAYTRELTPDVILDYGNGGVLIGIEILRSFTIDPPIAASEAAATEKLRQELERLKLMVQAADTDADEYDSVKYGEFDGEGNYTPPDSLPNIPKLEARIRELEVAPGNKSPAVSGDVEKLFASLHDNVTEGSQAQIICAQLEVAFASQASELQQVQAQCGAFLRKIEGWQKSLEDHGGSDAAEIGVICEIKEFDIDTAGRAFLARQQQLDRERDEANKHLMSFAGKIAAQAEAIAKLEAHLPSEAQCSAEETAAGWVATYEKRRLKTGDFYRDQSNNQIKLTGNVSFSFEYWIFTKQPPEQEK